MSELTPAQQSPEIPEPQPTRISVVIVSFNRAALLRMSLEALGTAHQIVVVDNGSTDGSPAAVEEFPHVRLMRLPRNFGLAKALNIALRAAEGDYILCLHDDARITGDAVTLLADFLEARQDAGAAAPLLVNESGEPVGQVRRLPSPSEPDPPLAPADVSTGAAEIQAECVSGAAIMFRSFFLRATRQLDERYGTYGTDIEICAQMRRAGKKVVIVTAAKAIHEREPGAAPERDLAADRAAGTAVFLGKHNGFVAGLFFRIKTVIGAAVTFRFSVLMGALGQKIDGTR